MKLVVIDDSPDFLGLAEYLLRKALPECRVTRFDPNAIGLPDAGHGFEEYDLILLDAELGASGSGVDWLCNACETPGFPPVIVLTASRDPYLAARAIKVGAADYLVKADMKPERLAQVICDALGQGSERSTTVQRSGRQGLATGATRAGNRSHASRTRSASTRAASSSPAEEETLVLDEPLADIEEPPQEVSVRGYRIAEELGKGATARVFRAERESDGQEIVLKVVTPELLNEAELLERFLQEAELVVDIDSRHVVKIYEQAFTDDGGFIAMEYLPGGDLRCLLDGPLPEPIAVDYLRQILLGLEAIHAVGIVHRDMKPEN
ncbi:MAG: protein kinase, partial [Gammaproteobacteria bacterium]|nr:protein kinase [Gammaproteobacteria bacterium]